MSEGWHRPPRTRLRAITAALCVLIGATALPSGALALAGSPIAASAHGQAVSCAAAPGHVLVRFDARASASERGALRASVAGTRARAFRLVPGLELIRTSMPFERAAAGLRGRPGIAYVEPDCRVQLADAPNDPSYGSQWALTNTGQSGGTPGSDIDAAGAWAVRTDASAVTVAVIDTGMQLNHPDLAANLWTNPGETPGNGLDDDHNGYVDDVHGWDFANDDESPEDDHGHGTHVSGTIGAVGDNAVGVTGIAWNVRIMPLKAFDASGGADISVIIAALDYAVANGARISNNSYSGTDFSQSQADAFAAAAAAGHLAVAAAGNDSVNNDVAPRYPASFGMDSVLSVAATTNTDALAPFSDYGTLFVQVAAPGVGILSTVPGSAYGNSSGTSMAAPHVVGVAALVAAEHPTWTAAEVRDRILGTTRHVPALDSKVWTGGVVDAGKALSSDPTVLPEAPLVPTVTLQAASDTGSSPSDGVTNASDLTYDIVFNRPVTGLTGADLSVTGSTAIGCAIGSPAGADAAYTVTVSGCGPGTVVLSVKAGTVIDTLNETGPPARIRAHEVLVDRSAPSTSGLAATLRTGVALSGSAVPFRLKWAASDPGGAGVATTKVERSINGSTTWTTVNAAVIGSVLDLTAAPSGTVRYRARTTDRAGNLGGSTYSLVLTPRLVQQNSTAVKYAGSWSTSTSTLFSGGSSRSSSSAGASATYTFTGRTIALVSTRATTRGKVRIYVGGTYVGTVDLYASSTTYRAIAWQKSWSTVGTRTIRFVVSGTSGRPRFDLDALVTIR